MNKLQVTAEQAKAIKARLEIYTTERFINLHANNRAWGAEDAQALNSLSVADLAKALYVGYEIPQPTPQEIFWAELDRPDKMLVVGDVVLTKSGVPALIVDDSKNLSQNNCYINDVIRWLDEGYIKAIYPVESRKDFPHAES
jgi:hypothetical protein